MHFCNLELNIKELESIYISLIIPEIFLVSFKPSLIYNSI